MPEYLAPGVYVEEVDRGAKPIEGVSTSTVGLVGATEMGPVEGLPSLVTSFADFKRKFGGFLPENPWNDRRFLAYAVQGFFQNGGKRAYIRRVVGEGAAAASIDLIDGISVAGNSFLLSSLAENMDDDRNEIVLTSSLGIQRNTALTLIERDGPAEISENIAITDVTGNRATLAAATGHRFKRSAVVLIAAPGSYGNPENTLRLQAANPGEWGERLRIKTIPSIQIVTRLLGLDLSTRLERQAIPLTVDTIAQGGNNVTLDSVAERDNLRDQDVLRFGNGADTEERTITLGPGNDQVEFANALGLDYTLAANSVELVTPVALRVNADTSDITINIEVTPNFQIHDRIIIEDDAGIITGEISHNPPVANNILRILLDTPLPPDRDLMAGLNLRLLNAGRDNDSIRVAGARNLYEGAAVELQNSNSEKIYAIVQGIEDGRVILSENVPSTYLENDILRTCEFDLQVQLVRENPLTRREEVVREEYHRFLNLSDGSLRNAITRINDDSKLLSVEDLGSGNSNPFNFPTTIDRNELSSTQYLQNGADGAPPLPRHYMGTDGGPGQRTGLKAITEIDQVSIIAVPGITNTDVQQAMLIQCENLKDRFAILDVPENSQSTEDVAGHRQNFDSKYGAMYHPWVKIKDILDGKDIFAPPSGYMAGIYARSDIERGVHKAPANEVVRGIKDLKYRLGKGEQDILNPPPNQVNIIRDFRKAGRGLRVWGARCITSDSSWKYVNVRRLFIYVEESIEEGTQWVVFEPNDHHTWARVRQSVKNFLTNVWRDGALQGRKVEDAFYVKCDETTMTQTDIDNGKLIMEIGIAPVKPAEFVIFRIGQWTAGSEVEES